MRDEWYVARRGQDGNKRYGPVPLDQLRELVDTGKVRGEDLVWRDGMAEWQRADQCDVLFPPARPPRREPRDYPPDDRRGYAPGPGRGPRGYGPDDDDDRPYRRRYPPPRSSSGGAMVGLLIGGGILVLLVLGCGGLAFIGYLTSRASATYKSATYGGAAKPFLRPPEKEDVRDDEAMVNPNLGGVPVDLGQSLPYGLSEVYYTNNVAVGDAQAVGDYLSNTGYFPADRGVTVQVDRDVVVGTYKVRFCIRDGAAWDPGTAAFFRDLRNDAEQNVLAGGGVEVDLCDGNMNTVRTLRAGD